MKRMMECGASSNQGDRFVLGTPRLTLREFSSEDVDALARVLSDEETMRYYPVPLTGAEVEQWIERNRRRYRENGYGLWAMILKPRAEVIGDCGLVKQTVEGVDEIEIGYHLRRDCWQQGLATEAARACRNYGFARLKVDRLISLIRPENLPSRRVAEKNGMTLWKEVIWHGLPHSVFAVRSSEITAIPPTLL